jgi:tRNA threonylcarbamoyl adenosine modification protein (Sua5/YciO/YrdC/YwlC family)
VTKTYDCSVDTDLLTGLRIARVSLGRDELVVLPTDTVYGIACDAFSAKGVEALLAAKGRGPQSPPPVLIANQATLLALAEEVPQVGLDLAEKFWPGALTLIVHARGSLNWNLGETKGTVALRIPDQKITLSLLEEVGPLAVSSANLTGQPAATTAKQATEYFGDRVSVYLDAGDSTGGEASTILDLTDVQDGFDADGQPVTTGKIRVVRVGAIAIEKIREVAQDLIDESAAG